MRLEKKSWRSKTNYFTCIASGSRFDFTRRTFHKLAQDEIQPSALLLRQEIAEITVDDPIMQKSGKELKKPEYKILKLLTNEKDKIDHERELMPIGNLKTTLNRFVGLRSSKIYRLKKFQVVSEKLPLLTTKFPAYQSRAAEQEERNKTVRSMKILQNRIRRPEPHMTIVLRSGLIERDRIPKVDIQATFSSYEEIEFESEEVKKEKSTARGVVSSMDADSARRYDNQLVAKAWESVVQGSLKVARYFQK